MENSKEKRDSTINGNALSDGSYNSSSGWVLIKSHLRLILTYLVCPLAYIPGNVAYHWVVLMRRTFDLEAIHENCKWLVQHIATKQHLVMLRLEIMLEKNDEK